MRAVAAGALYFGLVYMAGFVLGFARELLVAPALGRIGAVLAEAPLMIAAMTLAALHVGRNLAIPLERGARLVMGGVGFVVLMIAEIAFARILRGHDLAQWLAGFLSIEGAISAALFLLFAAMPFLVRHAGDRKQDGAPGAT